MNEKGLLLILILGFNFYLILIMSLRLVSEKRPVPNNVSDIWPSGVLKKKRQGNIKSLGFLIKCLTVYSFVVLVAFFTDIISIWLNLFSHSTVIRSLAAELIIVIFLAALVLVLRHYINIREACGIGKTSWHDIRKKVFGFSVCVAAISFILFLTVPAPGLGKLLNYKVPPYICLPIISLLFVVSPLLVLLVLYGFSRKIPDGLLADKIGEIIRYSGLKHCFVRMIAIENNERMNGCCTQFFKWNFIFLNCNPDQELDEEILLSIAAHEVGHCVHNHRMSSVALVAALIIPFVTLYLLPIDSIGVCIFVGFAFLFVYFPAVNIVFMSFSRKREYEADSFAAEAGYAESSIRGFRGRLQAVYELLNPHPLLVRLMYEHPPISQRIAVMEEKIGKIR